MPFEIDPGGDPFAPGDPAHGICIAFDDDAMEPTPTWTRLDDPLGYRLADGFQIHRGRESELDITGVGTASVSFRDTEGLLDPMNPTGPFYGKLVPRRQACIALFHPITAVWHPIFTGFTKEQNNSLDMWTADRGLDRPMMVFEDAFGYLANILLTRGVHGDPTSVGEFTDIYYHGIPSNLRGVAQAFCHVDDRINQILDDAGWPATRRDIFSGNVSVQGVVYERGDQILSALWDAADAELPTVANIFPTRFGDIAFRGRFSRFFPENPGYGIAHWFVGGEAQALADPDVVPMAGPVFPRTSEDDIMNSYIALPAGPITEAQAAANLVEDATSITLYGYRHESADNLLTSAGHTDATPTTAMEECLKFGQYRVGNYKDPQTRISTLKLIGRGEESINAQALWDMICQVEIGDLVSVETTHAGGGGFDEDFFVEGISYEAHPMRDDMLEITCELNVSPRSFYNDNVFGSIDLGES